MTNLYQYVLITTSAHAFGARYGFLKYDKINKRTEVIIPVGFKEDFLKQKEKVKGIFNKGDEIRLRMNRHTCAILSELLEGTISDSELTHVKGFKDDEFLFTILNSDRVYETPIPFTIDGILYVPDTIEFLKDINKTQ